MRVDLSCTSSYAYPPSNVAQTLCAGRRTLSSHVGGHQSVRCTCESWLWVVLVGARHSFVLQKPKREKSYRSSIEGTPYSYAHRPTGAQASTGRVAVALRWHRRSERPFPASLLAAGCWSPESGLPQSHPPRRFAAREGRPEPGSAPRQQDESSSAPVLRLAAACLTSDECCTAATVWHVRGSLVGGVARSPSPAQSRLAARSVPGPCIRLRITALPVRVCLVYEIKIFRCHRCFGMLE